MRPWCAHHLRALCPIAVSMGTNQGPTTALLHAFHEGPPEMGTSEEGLKQE